MPTAHSATEACLRQTPKRDLERDAPGAIGGL